MANAKEGAKRDYETAMKQNNYWLSQLSLKYEYGENPETLLAVPDYYRKIDAAMIQAAARQYLNVERYVRVSLMPEKQ